MSTMTAPRRWAAAAGLLASSWCLQAQASDLSWSGPAECRESEQLLFQVERALGAPLAETGHVHLQVHIARVAPDARALLRIASADASAATSLKERLLVAPDCAALVDTLAVAIALAVEAVVPAVSAVRAAPPAPPPSAQLAAAQAPPSDAAPSPKPKEAGAGLVASVSALFVADSGSLPNPVLGTALGVQLIGVRWRLELLGTLWLEQHPELPNVPGVGADVDLATGALLGCADPFGSGSSALSLALCASWEMGRLSGSGTGVDRPRSASALWLAPGVQAALSYRVPGTRLSLDVRAGGVMPLDRGEFVLEGLGTIHQPASLAARAALGVSVALE